MHLHYGRDDFASEDRLVRMLSHDRAKDTASDCLWLDPVQSCAERRGITCRERVSDIVRKIVLDKVRGMFESLRSPSDVPDPEADTDRAGEAPDRSDPLALRRASEALLL